MLRAVRERLSGYQSEIVTKNLTAAQGHRSTLKSAVKTTTTSWRGHLHASVPPRLGFRVEELKIDVDKRKPELPITIDREKARRYGLSRRTSDTPSERPCSGARSAPTRTARTTTPSMCVLRVGPQQRRP